MLYILNGWVFGSSFFLFVWTNVAIIFQRQNFPFAKYLVQTLMNFMEKLHKAKRKKNSRKSALYTRLNIVIYLVSILYMAVLRLTFSNVIRFRVKMKKNKKQTFKKTKKNGNYRNTSAGVSTWNRLWIWSKTKAVLAKYIRKVFGIYWNLFSVIQCDSVWFYACIDDIV